MSLPFIKFSEPEIGNEEIKAALSVMRSGWLTSGPKVFEFENNFSNYLNNVAHCSAVNSATSGLHLALESLGLKPGDEVILPTLTFTASAEAIDYLGLNIKFCDVDSSTLNIDINSMLNCIGPKTKAIMVVHFGGLSCNMDEIIEIARKHKLFIIEDAAHAFPSLYKSKLIGTLDTDATVFSFYANKTMTTGGEGGMVVTKSKKRSKRIKLMRVHGIDRDVHDRFVSKKPSWFYTVIESGYKYNLTDLAASIGIEQLKKIDSFTSKRRLLANFYLENLPMDRLDTQITAENINQHSCHLFIIKLKNSSMNKRNELINFLSKKGIGTSVHYIPLHRQPYWKHKYNLKSTCFPNAELVYKSSISLPLYPSLKKK